jgi:hypothetical protein
MVTLLYPQPMTKEYIEHAVEKHLKSHREESDVVYLKVIDTSLGGKMIACAKWRINFRERTEEQIQSQLPKPGPDEEGRPAAIDFMNYLTDVRRKYMGTKPFVCKFARRGMLTSLTLSSPAHLGYGSGASPTRRRREADSLWHEEGGCSRPAVFPGSHRNGQAAV